jgi:hypothetical protein
MSDVYCRFEAREFPSSEFEEDPHWGLVHQTASPHTTMGSPVDEGWELQGLGGM